MGGMKNGFVYRRRFTAQERGELIDQYLCSGLTQRAFVEKHSLGLATLTKWLREHRQSKNQSLTNKTTPDFQALDLSGVLAGSNWAAEVVLSDGVTLRLSAGAGEAFTNHLLQTLRRAC